MCDKNVSPESMRSAQHTFCIKFQISLLSVAKRSDNNPKLLNLDNFVPFVYIAENDIKPQC